MKYYLTKSGNILIMDRYQAAFFSPSGDLLREVSIKEAKYLSGICSEITIKDFEHIEVGGCLPVWRFIISLRVLEDDSNYRQETSINEGGYSFSTYHDWYCAKYPSPSGEWTFGYIERYSTSSEFSYDELSGKFQNSNMGYLYISNLASRDARLAGKYYTQCPLDAEGYPEDIQEVFEKVAIKSTFENMMNEKFVHFPGPWEEEKSQENIILIKNRLLEIGVESVNI